MNTGEAYPEYSPILACIDSMRSRCSGGILSICSARAGLFAISFCMICSHPTFFPAESEKRIAATLIITNGTHQLAFVRMSRKVLEGAIKVSITRSASERCEASFQVANCLWRAHRWRSRVRKGCGELHLGISGGLYHWSVCWTYSEINPAIPAWPPAGSECRGAAARLSPAPSFPTPATCPYS